MKEKGVTLIVLVITIIILAMIATITTVKTTTVVEANKYKKFKNDLIINILIGSEKQNIPLSLRFFEYQHL